MAPISFNLSMCRLSLVGILSCIVLIAPAQAARPLLDQHQWDRAFALFARDANLPWRPTTVRLETYSSAPVEFSAYPVDTADVIVVNRPQGRALNTRNRRPLVRWTFHPPSGYRVEGNAIRLPLGQREGIFVIEARRGSAVQQVWVNRTRIGLVSKEAPEGLLVYGTDLGTGRPLVGMRMLFLMEHHLEKRMSDRHGIVRWNGQRRPRFVLAEWGASRSFLAFLPQAPVPTAIAAVRVDRSVVRGGETLNVVGFVRRRQGKHYVPATGNAHVSLFLRGHLLAVAQAPLDEAGAFATHMRVPNIGMRGQATVVATIGHISSGAEIEMNAADDVVLGIRPQCTQRCVAKHPVPLLIMAHRQGIPAAHLALGVRVVRYPHIFPPGINESNLESWGATTVVAKRLYTNRYGGVRVNIPAAADGLPSTLGIVVTTLDHSASASTRFELPNSAVALEIKPEHDQVDIGESIGVGLRGFAAEDGRPISGVVRVTISHGLDHMTHYVKLNGQGRGHALFRRLQFGDNLITAVLTSPRGSAIDANSVQVEPQALREDTPASGHVVVHTTQARYHPGEKVVVDAQASGAKGVVLVSVDDWLVGHYRVAPVRSGYAHQGVLLGDSQGRVQASVAFVRNGAIVTGTTALAVDGPGHERMLDLVPNAGAYHPGEIAQVLVRDGLENHLATTIVRVTDTLPSGSADFQSMGDMLTIGGVTTQVSAGDDPPWHSWVSPQNSRATDLFADLGRRPLQSAAPDLSDAALHVSYWQVERSGSRLEIPLPQIGGRYILSVMRIYDDGEVGAATTVLAIS